MHDLLIRDALIVDGTGGPARAGDVVVAGGRIVAAGPEVGAAAARRTIDASGRVVAPGFIDLHTHIEYNLERFPRAQSMVRQGVTTFVVGNCGFSPFPTTPAHRADLLATSAFLPGAPSWDWTDAETFLATLERLPLAGNVATLVGHGALRIAAMGLERRPPSGPELERMKLLLGESLRAGAFGLSSGLIYAPGNFATTDELAELAGVVAEHGGFYASHIRGEGDGLLESVDEAIEIGRLSGVAVQVSHVKATGERNWGRLPASLERMERARAAGLDVLSDQYPYTASSTTMTALLPQWAMDGGVERLMERLEDAGQRARIRDQLTSQSPEMVRQGMRAFEPHTAWVSGVPDGPAKPWEGRKVIDIAAEAGVSPAELVLRLLEWTGGNVRVVLFSMSEEDVRAGLRDPTVAVGSDGATLSPAEGGRPHPRSYGTFVRVLGHYVREERVLTLEAAVHKMTALPARRMGLADRGQIRVGTAADLVLFDPAAVADRATFDEPHQFGQGVSHVLVDGQLVIDDGEDTDAAAGRVLRRA